MALAGVAIGAAVTWLVIRGKSLFAERFGDDSGSNILVSLLIPFGAYLAAEHVHAPGVLAAAASGIAMTFASGGVALGAGTRIRRRAVWDMLQFTLNGVIFVLLGEQLPWFFNGAQATVAATGHSSAWWLLLYVGAIVAALAALRFAWVGGASADRLECKEARRGKCGKSPASDHRRHVRRGRTRRHHAWGALTLPPAMPDGSPFPARDLAILLASGVILASLVIAAVGLPLLLRGLQLPADDGAAGERDRARIRAAKAAIAEIERVQHQMAEESGEADISTDVAARIGSISRADRQLARRRRAPVAAGTRQLARAKIAARGCPGGA